MSKSFTSVKIDKVIYEQFKKMSINRKFHLQDLVNKSMHLFITDESFRNTVYNHVVPVLSNEPEKVEKTPETILTENTNSAQSQ